MRKKTTMKYWNKILMVLIPCLSIFILLGFGVLAGGKGNKEVEANVFPQSCVCSDFTPLSYRADPRKNEIFRMALFHCQCGNLQCAVSERAISCAR